MRRAALFVLRLALVYLLACIAGLLLLRWVNPPTTGVQAQRRIESLLARTDYQKRARFVPLGRINENLQHAVVAAEDGSFYSHGGIDWPEIEKMIEEELPRGRLRGASTITQQLVKNLFMTTHRNPVRKPVEFLLAPVAENTLGKQRILELYLNIVEWGPGVYGAEAAAQYHYGTSAASLTRERSARLAAILPSPRRWRPQSMDKYSAIILDRMDRRGW